MAAAKLFEYLHPYSFEPPTLPDPEAVSTASTPSPEWVLLDTKAYVSDRRNGTTATASASNGTTVDVTFCFAATPTLSHLCVHFKGGEASGVLAEEPRVVCSDKHVAILCLYWCTSHATRYRVPRRDYFVYTARSNGAPSLVRLPNPYPRAFHPLLDLDIGLLPTADGEDFVIAVLRAKDMFPDICDLHIFSSKTWRWTSKYVQLDPQLPPKTKAMIRKHRTDKVITLVEDGSLGWVDLWRGILVCNVLDVDDDHVPVVRFIPLPRPMACNRDNLSRDVAYVNGSIRCFEMEMWEEESSTPKSKRRRGPPDDDVIPDMQFDSELELLEDDDDSNTEEEDTEVTFGWRVVACVRDASKKAWIKNCEANLDDIAIGDNGTRKQSDSVLPPLKKLITSAPTLSSSMHRGDDVMVYLMSKLNINDDDAWVIALNVTRKTLEDVALFSAKRTFSYCITYRPSSLSRHLDMTAPDNRQAGLQSKEGEDAKSDSEDTTLLVERLDPSVTEDQLRRTFAHSGEVVDIHIHEDRQCASVKFLYSCSAENAISEFRVAMIGRGHVRVSWKCPNKQSRNQTPMSSSVNGCKPRLEATWRKGKNRCEDFEIYMHELRRLTLPFRNINGAVQGYRQSD